jgi:serine/threonine protein phosphatase PrpC
MQDTAQISCPNPLCQALNPETHRYCEQCRTLMPKRYLWVTGGLAAAYKEGQLLAQRYLVKGNGIVLDTKPGFLPEFPSEIPPTVAPYLRLFPFRLHVPQVYGMAIAPGKKGKPEPIWLLEQIPIYSQTEANTADRVQILPELTSCWQNAPAGRQLNWLWQMAMLWQPLAAQGVASSLLNLSFLRIEGQLVRLLELELDRTTPTLASLGLLWSKWVDSAKEAIAPLLKQLCQQMMQDDIGADQLVAQLDGALAQWGKSGQRSYQIITRTDTGPSRARNEDACYPSDDTPLVVIKSRSSLLLPGKSPIVKPLTIVCDGIGGHEGGNVASNLAIASVQEQLEPLLKSEENWLPPESLENQLELAVCAANDRISQQNDTESRTSRQRMGTTLVMALAQGHEVYITHVGDSRAYWITRSGCHQVTLDDDVASREVRLGYGFYREALQQIGSGSLVQALGMGPSSNLHPTVQRFVIDEDCIFLLTSDGLSDGDRVEQSWETEILPVLEGKIDLAQAAARLIEIANTQNGHDNVTIGLLYCQVSAKEENFATRLWGGKSASTVYSFTSIPQSALKTQLLPPQRTAPKLWPLLLGIPLLLGLGGLLAYLLIPEIGERVNRVISPPTDSPSSSLPAASPTTEAPPPSAVVTFSPGSLIEIKRNTGQGDRLILFNQPASATNPSTPPPQTGVVPGGSLLQVLNKQSIPQQPVWLRLKVCSSGATAAKTPQTRSPASSAKSAKKPPSTPANRIVPPGEVGWVLEADVVAVAVPNSAISKTKLGDCIPSEQ